MKFCKNAGVFCRFVCGTKGQVTLEKEWSTIPKVYAFQAVAKVCTIKRSVDHNERRPLF